MSQQSIPDTHAAIFTQIPKSITKTWTPKTISVSSSNCVATPSSKHCESIVTEIKLCVEFNQECVSRNDDLDENTDSTSSFIGVWQETRRDWASLERAVASAVEEFNNRSKERATESKLVTVDCLERTKTEFVIPTTQRTQVEPNRSQTQHNTGGASTVSARSKVETLYPLDSASNLDNGDIRRFIQNLRAPQSKGKARASRNSSKSLSVLKAFTN